MKFQGKVSEDGLLTIINRKAFDEAIKAELSGKYVTIEVNRKKSVRSNPQNAYYWSCVLPIMQCGLKVIGHRLSKDDIHLFLRGKFLKQELCNGYGEAIGSRIKSTTELLKSEFMDYLAEITQFAAEYLSIVVPQPNEQIKIDKYINN